jgi:hypothetical protein
MANKRVVKPGKSINQIERFLYECCANLADIKKDHKRNAKPWYKYDRLHWKLSQLGFELGLAKCDCIDMEEFKKGI